MHRLPRSRAQKRPSHLSSKMSPIQKSNSVWESLFGQARMSPKNEAEAVKWFRRAAEQGHREAQFVLAYACEEGIGISTDAKLAVEWYRKAAEQGHRSAQRTIGVYHLHGDLLPKDAKEAAHWLQLAADQEEPAALYNLSACYRNGLGVPPDYNKACALLKRAADAGHEQAAKLVKQLR
jgi:TPR repeat protein